LRPEVAPPSSLSTTASPSISDLSTSKTANRLGDRREPIREVRAVAAPDLRALAQVADKNAETVMLHFVQPTGSGGRAINERGLAWAYEPDRRDPSSPAPQPFEPADVPDTLDPAPVTPDA
jgi:hypothetical protein